MNIIKQCVLGALLFSALITLSVRILEFINIAPGGNFAELGELYMIYVILWLAMPMFMIYLLLHILHIALKGLKIIHHLPIELLALFVAFGFWVCFLMYSEAREEALLPGGIALIVLSCSFFVAGSLPLGRWRRQMLSKSNHQ